MKKFIFTSILLLVTLNVNAQESTQIPQQIIDFYDYEGRWEGEAEVTMGGETGKGSVINIWSKISDGWGMLIDEVIDIPLMGKPYIGHNILGYDIGEGVYHLFTVDNFADVHDHEGKMTGNTMYLEHNGVTPDGKTYKEEIYWSFINKNEYSIKVNAIVSGEMAFVINLTAKKVK